MGWVGISGVELGGIPVEWHKDTVTFVEDWPPHEDDMFASWQI